MGSYIHVWILLKCFDLDNFITGSLRIGSITLLDVITLFSHVFRYFGFLNIGKYSIILI